MLNKNFSNRPLYGVFLSGAQKVLDRPLYVLFIPAVISAAHALSVLVFDGSHGEQFRERKLVRDQWLVLHYPW